MAYDDGKSYAGDPFRDATIAVRCDQADTAIVQNAFAAVWTAMGTRSDSWLAKRLRACLRLITRLIAALSTPIEC